MKIELVRFEDGLADFEIGDLTARCNVSNWDLNEFLNGELIIKPYAWFDMNDEQGSLPHRQLRSSLDSLRFQAACSLPHRQLRRNR